MRTLVLLAGGKSSRMGSDKVMLPINGKTFIENSYERASACFERIIISTDTEEHAGKIRSLPLFAAKDMEIVIDKYSEAGPAGGLLSVFEQTDADKFSVISVDVPYAQMEVLRALYDKCTKSACFFKIGERKAEPLIAAWSRRAADKIKGNLLEEKLKLRRILEKDEIDILTDEQFKRENPDFAQTDFARVFRNFNTQEELEKLYE